MQTLRPGSDAGGEPVLVVATPSGFAQQLRITGGAPLVAGRDAALPISIPDDSVSRRHAEFRFAPLAVRDLGSTNGTRVQGVPVGDAWVPLDLGMIVELGDAVVLVRSVRGLTADAIIPAKRAERPAPPSTTADRVVADPAMARLYSLVELVAPSRLGVLILGETGSGKEVVAHALHHASDRRAARLLTLNCAALAASLLESELFGFEKGAFTGAAHAKPGLFEAAAGGTVFLDEIGEMPLETQAKLLRVLESGEVLRIGALAPVTVDVRFVAATHRDVAALARDGRFRLDLLFRISGVTLEVPPLRDRREDIVPLAHCFLRRARTRGPLELTPAAIDALLHHAWPGNVRELKSTIERAELLSRGAPIDAPHLTFGVGIALGLAPPPDAPTATTPAPIRDEVAALERRRILAALDACGGNQSRAARSLGISRATLIRRLEAYGATRPRK